MVRRNTGIASFGRGVQAFAEAALIALAFGIAIFVIGLPLALSMRVAHEGLSWLAGSGSEMGPLASALVSTASVAGGIILTAGFARGFFGFVGRRMRR